MPLIFAVLTIMPAIVFVLVGLLWARFSLKARRDKMPYLAVTRGIAALLSFGVAAFLLSLEFTILTV